MLERRLMFHIHVFRHSREPEALLYGAKRIIKEGALMRREDDRCRQLMF